LSLLLAGCSATSNPRAGDLRPAPLPGDRAGSSVAAPAASPADGKPAAPAADPAAVPSTSSSSPNGGAANAQVDPQPASSTPSASGSLPIAIVAGEAIEARAFLVRSWLRNSDQTREILDHLVVERLAILEAERLGVAILPEQVEARVKEAQQALEKKLAESGSKLTPEQHIRQKLGLEPELYARELRRETIAQLVAERVVRLWSMGHERVAARLLEIEGRERLDQAQAALAAGESFLDVAKRFGPAPPPPGAPASLQAAGERVVLTRAENSTVAHLAFSTPPGQVGGPIEQQGRFLLVAVEQLLPPVTGAYAEIAPQVEASLADNPIDDFEYLQWRNDVVGRYPVDLTPFRELIGHKP
jgi:parvulin-like peptidyl-prolyl cis-trans isomerase-like protein